MKRLSSHKAVRVAVLVLMSLSVMGFTTVINFCTMTHTTDCCCQAEHAEQNAAPAVTPSIGNPDGSCNLKVIAGGLNPVAQNVISESAAKSITIDLVTPDAGIHTFPIVPHIPLLIHANDIAPPSVDIYIRTANLLI